MSDIPFVAFSNDELDGMPEIGDTAICPNCGKMHKVEYGNKINEDGSKTPSKLLAFIDCPENGELYLVGLNGKLI